MLDRVSRVELTPVLLVRADGAALADAAARREGAGLVARFVRGWRMRTVGDLLDEVGAALQFMPRFGRNWNAFNECLAEMDLLPRLGGIALAVLDAHEMLAEEDAAQTSAFLRAVARARDAYAQPIASGESWDRPPVPFHVVLGCSEEQEAALLARLAAAGAAGLVEEAELESGPSPAQRSGCPDS